MVECPTCGAEISIAGTEPGQIISCPDCSTELEVTKSGVEAAPQEEEDWGE